MTQGLREDAGAECAGAIKEDERGPDARAMERATNHPCDPVKGAGFRGVIHGGVSVTKSRRRFDRVG